MLVDDLNCASYVNNSNTNESVQGYMLLRELQNMISTTTHNTNSSKPPVLDKISLGNLNKLLNQAPDELIEKVGSKILFPLIHVLEQNYQCATENELMSLLDCLKIVLSQCGQKDEDADLMLAKKLTIVVTKLLPRQNLPEELICLCFELLCFNLSTPTWFYNYENLPLLAIIVQNVLQFVKTSEKEKQQCVKVQLNALKVLNSLLNPVLTCENSVVVMKRRSCMFASIFPGTASVLFKCCLNCAHLKAAVFCQVFVTVANLITVVLQSYKYGAKKDVDEDLGASEVPDKVKTMLATQNEEWLQKVLTHFDKFLSSLQPIVLVHKSDKVRCESIQFCDRVLTQCSSELNESCNYFLIWTLLCFGSDKNDQVASLAWSVRQRILSSDDATGGGRLACLNHVELQFKFFQDCISCSEKIGEYVNRGCDESLSVLLTKILACLSIIDNEKCFKLPSILMRFLSNLCAALIVEMNTIQILESYKDHNYNTCEDRNVEFINTTSQRSSENSLDFVIKFKNLSKENYSLITQICSHIQSSVNFCSLIEVVDSQIDKSDFNNIKSLSYLSLLSIIVHTSKQTLSLSKDLPSNQFYLNSLCENQVSSACDVFNNPVSKNLIAYFALSLKFVDTCSHILGKDLDLKLILYKVAMFATHTVSLVSSLSVQTLLTISSNSYSPGTSIAHLIHDNSSYIFSDCIIKFKHVVLYPQVINVLWIIFQFVDCQSLLFAKDVTKECSLQLKNSAQLKYPKEFQVRIFSLLVQISQYLMRNYYNDHTEKELSSSNEAEGLTLSEGSDTNATSSVLCKELLDFVASNINSSKTESALDSAQSSIHDETIRVDKNESEDDDGQPDVQVWEPETEPVHVQIVNEILLNCVYYSTCEDFKIKVYCLTCAENCFRILHQEKRKSEGNYLLPKVHQFWKPTVFRLKDPKSVIVLKSFKLILLFSQISEDFVRKKVAQDCVDVGLDWLRKMLNNFISQSNFSISLYDKTTHDFKLLTALVEHFPSLLINSKIVPLDRQITFTLIKLISSYVSLFKKGDSFVYQLAEKSRMLLRKQDPFLVDFIHKYLK